MPPRIVAIANQMAGVGKTATSINLSAALALVGHRVLLVDLDPKGVASLALGASRSSPLGSYDLLMDYADLAETRRITHISGVELVPSTRELVGAPIELREEENAETRLRRGLHSCTYDYIVLDCPSSLNLLAINALVAADSVLIPMRMAPSPMAGLGELLTAISMVRRQWNPRLRREGILLTMCDDACATSRRVQRETRDIFGEDVFDLGIPVNQRLSEGLFSQAIVHRDPLSEVSQAYQCAAEALTTGHR